MQSTSENQQKFIMATIKVPLQIKSDSEIEAMPYHVKVSFEFIDSPPDKQESDAYYSLLMKVLTITKHENENRLSETIESNGITLSKIDDIYFYSKTQTVLPSEIKKRKKPTTITFKNKLKFSHQHSAKVYSLANPENNTFSI